MISVEFTSKIVAVLEIISRVQLMTVLAKNATRFTVQKSDFERFSKTGNSISLHNQKKKRAQTEHVENLTGDLIATNKKYFGKIMFASVLLYFCTIFFFARWLFYQYIAKSFADDTVMTP